MEYKRFEDRIAVRLDRSDEICGSILKIAEAEHIGLATVSGIGATDDADIGVFDTETKTYCRNPVTGMHEITSLLGNLSTKDGVPYLHLHITVAGEGEKTEGGHLLRCVISLTAEIFITVIAGKAERSYDEALGLNRLVF